MSYIDLTKIQIFDTATYIPNVTRVSMTKIREALDAYEATGLPLGVDGILVTIDQYYAYERTLHDFIQSFSLNSSFSLPEKLKFNGIKLEMKYLND